MKRNTIAVIPLDDRSVNYECIAMLGQMADLEVLLPPQAWLGNPWREGQTDRVGAWLQDVAPRGCAGRGDRYTRLRRPGELAALTR